MSNLTSITEVGGKKLSKSQINLLAKLSSLGARLSPEGGVRQNPYSGASCALSPLAVTLYDFIINQYHAGMVGRAFPVSVWDRARYLFLALWPEEYYSLID